MAGKCNRYATAGGPGAGRKRETDDCITLTPDGEG
jgi:hypothetical protein